MRRAVEGGGVSGEQFGSKKLTSPKKKLQKNSTLRRAPLGGLGAPQTGPSRDPPLNNDGFSRVSAHSGQDIVTYL